MCASVHFVGGCSSMNEAMSWAVKAADGSLGGGGLIAGRKRQSIWTRSIMSTPVPHPLQGPLHSPMSSFKFAISSGLME